MSESPVRTYRDYSREYTEPPTFRSRLRAVARDVAIFGLATTRRIDRTSGSISFPYYHHVFADEAAGFDRQIAYMQRHGDFITLDEAVTALESSDPLNGRYFSLTFDDGFANCLSVAAPILAARNVPATVYVSTSLVGKTIVQYGEAEENDGRFRPTHPVEYLSWSDCRELLAAGIGIGSHSVDHFRLGEMAHDAVVEQMRASKATIERELGINCEHFCCPYGQPDRDFHRDREPQIARELGYRSFATGVRGAMAPGGNPFYLTREHLLGGWDNYQLRYFLSP